MQTSVMRKVGDIIEKIGIAGLSLLAIKQALKLFIIIQGL